MTIFEQLRADLFRSVRAGQALAGLTLAAACSGATSGGEGTGGTTATGGQTASGGHSSSSGGHTISSGGRVHTDGGNSSVAGYPDELAGAGGAPNGGAQSGGAGPGGDGGIGGGGAGGELEPYPTSGLTCYGPIYGAGGLSGYDGQCCYRAACYSPENDEACLPASADTLLNGRFGLGSGTCGCSDNTHPGFVGPYAPNPAAPDITGKCCYLVASITCEGRPLRIHDELLIAQVVLRRDWGLPFAA